MSIWKYFNPLYSFKRTYEDVSRSTKGITDSFKETRDILEKRSAAAEKAGRAATAAPPQERFKLAVEAGNWTEQELETQAHGARRARLIFIGSAYVFAPFTLACTLYAPWWLALMMVPSATFFFILMSILAAKHAWWEWQIEERSFESFKTFASRKDFFKRVLLP